MPFAMGIILLLAGLEGGVKFLVTGTDIIPRGTVMN